MSKKDKEETVHTSGDFEGRELINFLTADSFLGWCGFDITAFREIENGHIHLVIGLCGDNSDYIGDAARVFEMTEKLDEITYSRFTPEQIRKAYNHENNGLGIEWVFQDDEVSSIRSAFCQLAFGDEDPLYCDKVYAHCSDMNDFWGFCDECRRRRMGRIGIGMEDVSPKRECTNHERLVCATIWAARNQGRLERMSENDRVNVVGEDRKKYLSKKGLKTFAWKFKEEEKKHGR